MRSRPLRLIFAVPLLLTSFLCEVSAQTTTSGSLAGVVTDPSHAVVPDSAVEIKDNAKGTAQSTKTDREGLYRFFFLAPGRYTLTVSHNGFRDERRTVDVLLGPPITVNVSLEVATTNSEIRVSDEVPLLQAEDGDFSTAINREQISDLPNSGNDLTYIAQTAPGVVMNTDGGAGNFSSLGMPATSNLFTLNGMNDNDMGVNLNQTGPLRPMLGQNEIQEATVVTNGYSGQFGTLAGTNVNYITKSASNGFHGKRQVLLEWPCAECE
jgi:Carboxypeptidase regulatory-like domain